LGKLSEVLYEVDCGRNNEPQIIHCDRLKRKVKQRLRGESERDTYPVIRP
jgi:gluconate kinase